MKRKLIVVLLLMALLPAAALNSLEEMRSTRSGGSLLEMLPMMLLK